MRRGRTATIIGLIGNTFLFVIKLVVGIMSNSLALLSDAFNSLTDIISALFIFIAVRISSKKPDRDHPFGHRRAEPIAGLIVAVLAGILAFEILKEGILNLFHTRETTVGPLAIIVLAVTIIIKVFMARYFRRVGKEIRSPAISASAIDSQNDILVSVVALVGVLGAMAGLMYLDSIAALLIALWIFKSGFEIGKENIDYLMGRSPDSEMINNVKKRARSIKGVLALNDVRAHYVGNFIHAEVHINLDRKMTTGKAHGIAKKVQGRIEEMENVDRAFIHIDPS